MPKTYEVVIHYYPQSTRELTPLRLAQRVQAVDWLDAVQQVFKQHPEVRRARQSWAAAREP